MKQGFPGLGEDESMARMVKCVKFGKEMPGLNRPPFGGELGKKIFENVSMEAWKMYLEHFKMLMNEYRLVGGSEQATRAFTEQAERFFFGEGAQLPPEYVPQKSK